MWQLGSLENIKGRGVSVPLQMPHLLLPPAAISQCQHPPCVRLAFSIGFPRVTRAWKIHACLVWRHIEDLIRSLAVHSTGASSRPPVNKYSSPVIFQLLFGVHSIH